MPKPRPVFIPSSFDVVTGLPLDVPPQYNLPPSPPAQGPIDLSGTTSGESTYKSFSLLLMPIPSRFELDELCNVWEREVNVYFDLHMSGVLLQRYIPNCPPAQVRSLNRKVPRPKFPAEIRNKKSFSEAVPMRKTTNGAYPQVLLIT
jgi:hypothetical protein